MVETKIEIEDPENPTASKEVLLQIKNIEMAHESWKKLEESFEGTQAMKGCKGIHSQREVCKLQDEGG